MPRALVSCLLVLASRLRSGLTGLAGVTELIAQVGKLITKTGGVLVKGGRALSGLRGALAGSLRSTRRVLGSSPGFVAEPFENPDAFNQLLARCRIHDSNTARSPRGASGGATDRAAGTERPDRVPSSAAFRPRWFLAAFRRPLRSGRGGACAAPAWGYAARARRPGTTRRSPQRRRPQAA